MRRHEKAIVAISAMLLTLALAPIARADAPPVATVEPASPSYTSAHLSGHVNPNGGPSTTFWQLQYSLEAEGPWSLAGAGEFSGTEAEETVPLPVSADVTGLQHNTTYFFRLIAINEGGANQAIKNGPSFTTLEVAPASVSIDPVSGVTGSGAHFSGQVNPNAPEAEPATPAVEEAFATEYHFQCTPACPGLEGSLAADNSSHEVQAEASELLPGTEYEVTLIAKNAGPEASAGPETFTTLPLAPSVLSTSVSDLGSDSATLSAQINPNGDSTTYHFEYVTEQQFDESEFTTATSTPESAPIGADNASHPASADLDSLSPSTAYRYRVLATNSLGTTVGPIKAFKTFPEPQGGAGQFPGQGFLPDDRAWEMVSPPDKNGGNIGAASQRSRAATDGDAIQFVSLAGFADAKGSGVSFEYIARRTEEPGTNGWSTHAITPSQEGVTAGDIAVNTKGGPHYAGEFAADLSRGVFSAYSPVPTADGPHPMVEKAFGLYLGSDLTTPGAASYALISDCPRCAEAIPPQPLPFNRFPSGLPIIAGSNRGDATHEPLTNVAYEATLRLTADAPNAQKRLYEGVAEATDEIQTVAVNATAGQFTLGVYATNGRGTLANGSPTVSSVSTARGAFEVGQPIVGEGIPPGTTIAALGTGTLTLSAAATAAKTATLLSAGPLATTGDIPFDAPTASVEAALNSLSTIMPGSVSVTGGPGNAGATSPYVVIFTQGTEVEGTDMPQLITGLGTVPLSGGAATSSTSTRLGGGQHVRLAGRIPPGSATSCDDSAAPACVTNVTSIAGSNAGAAIENYAFNVVSDDGSRVIFRAPGTGFTPRSIYLREDGLRTIKLNLPETAPGPADGTEYWTASSDGSRIFFSTGEKLVGEDSNGSADLYMYDASKPASAPDNLTLISKGSAGSGGFDKVFGASEDGSHVYFTGGIQLVSGEPALIGTGLFHWNAGTVTYIGGFFNPEDVPYNTPGTGWGPPGLVNTARVSLDGSHLLFMTTNSEKFVEETGFAGYDHGDACTGITTGGAPCRQILVYSADSDTLHCASCHPSGGSTTPAGDALVDVRQLLGGDMGLGDQHLSQALSDDGRYVFFHTGEPLVLDDTNGQIDVYVYDTETEERRLISSGEDSRPSYLVDASDDGHDVFFDTAERLSKWDVDSSYDVYDARAGGGLPEPPPAPPSCQGDACQPAPVSLNDPTPSSSSFQGQGNEKIDRKPPARCPRGKRKAKSRSGKVRCLKRRSNRRGTDNDRRAGR